MVNKLIKTVLGILTIDDRDSAINKRVDTPGNLLGNLTYQCFHKIVKDIKTYMEELKTSIHSLKSIDKKLLLDLSLKQKSSYMLDNIQDNIDDIERPTPKAGL